jgi:hypothetical protein
VIFFLVFPLCGKANAWLGFYVVPPHILSTLAVGPYVLAGDAAGVAAYAFIEVKNH